MGNNKAIKGGRRKLVGGMLLSAVASGALAVGSLSGAGTANASCVSINGLFSGMNGCKSTLGNASAVIGTGSAESNGFLTTAVSFGTASAPAVSDSAGILTAAVATPGAAAFSDGISALSLAGGPGYIASAGQGGGLTNIGNFSWNLGVEPVKPGSSVVATSGVGNIGINSFSRASNVIAAGFGTFGWNAFSDDSVVSAGLGFPPNPANQPSILNVGFNLGGNNNRVGTSGFGPFAGGLGVSNRTITQNNFGFNIDVP